MAENKAFSGDEAETDFGGVETTKDVEITVDSKHEDGEIPEPYAGMPAEVLLLHSRKKGWVIGRLIGWLGKYIISITILSYKLSCYHGLCNFDRFVGYHYYQVTSLLGVLGKVPCLSNLSTFFQGL